METWSWIVSWVVTILTLTGNGFVIFLVCRKRHLRTKTNAFVVSLAMADFFVGLVTVPSLFVCEMTSECASQQYLPMMFIRVLFQYASGTNLCTLILDRYIAVVKPLKYLTFMKRRRVIQMISLSWGIPVTFIALVLPLRYNIKLPLAYNVTGGLYLTFELLVCAILIFCLASTLHVVCKQGQAARTQAKQLRFNHRLVAKTQGKSSVKIMAIVIGLFLICYGIYLQCSLELTFSKDPKCIDIQYKLPILILNSAVNPIAYAFFKRDIKKEFKRMICFVILKKCN